MVAALGMACLASQSRRAAVRGDISQTPSQGRVHFAILGWRGLLFKLVTNSKRGLGRFGERDLFLFYF